MNDNWNSYERAVDKGPLTGFFKIFGALIIVGAALGTCSYAFGWCGETAKVAQDELGPRALLDKYSWLKEAHAQLEKKQADIKVYKGSLQNLIDQNKGIPRNKWAREDRDQYNMDSTVVAGVIASYNDLAASYNSKMAEVHWAFCNQGTLPKGADVPLPREFAPYATE